MKKYNLMKIVIVTIFVTMLLTWLIPASSFNGSIAPGERLTLGIWTLASYPIGSLSYLGVTSYFGYVGLFVLAVGGFYGILNRTGVYKNVLDFFIKIFKGKEKWFLVSTIILLSLVSSFVGLTLGLFLFIPLIVSIILIMGYDRIVALFATVGAILVGAIGSTYGAGFAVLINKTLSLDINSEIISRLFLLVISTFLLIMYVFNYNSKNKKIKKNIEEKEFEDPLYINKKSTKKSVMPLAIILSVMALVTILSTIAWKDAFGITWFEDATQAIFKFKIFGFDLFNKVIGSIAPFGNWTIQDFTIMVTFACITIALIYRVKLDDAIEGFVDGAKKMIPTAIIVVLAYIVLFINAYHPFYLTITDFLLNLTKGFNIITMSILTAIGSVLSVDMTFLAQNTLPVATTVLTDKTTYGVMAVLFQAIYGLTMFVAPTSIILLIGLSYLKVPYTKWIKYISKLLLQLVIVILIIAIIIMVI